MSLMAIINSAKKVSCKFWSFQNFRLIQNFPAKNLLKDLLSNRDAGW